MHLPDPNQSKILCCKRVYRARWYEDMCNTIECVLHLGMSDRTTQCRKARRGQCPEDAPSISRVHDLFHVWVVGLQESFIGRFQRRQFLELLVGVHLLVLRQSLKTLCLCLNRNKGFLRNLANLCSTWPMHAHHVSIRSYSYKLIGTLSIIQDIDLHDMCNCACAFIRDIDRNDMCKCVCVCAHIWAKPAFSTKTLHKYQGVQLASICLFFSAFSKLWCLWWLCFRACWSLAKMPCNPWARHRCIAWRQTISGLPASSFPVLSQVPDVIYVCMC